MTEEWLYFTLFSFVMICIILIVEVVHHTFKTNSEILRALAFMLSGIMSLIFPFIFFSWSALFALSTTFMVLLSVLELTQMLQSIFALDRPSMGNIVYPLTYIFAFAVAHLIGELYPYYFIVLLTTLADGSATIVGNLGIKTKEFFIQGCRKTFIGSFAYFVVAFVGSVIIFNSNYFNIPSTAIFIFSAVIGLVFTLIEMISIRGFDSLSLPVCSAIMSCFLSLYLV